MEEINENKFDIILKQKIELHDDVALPHYLVNDALKEDILKAIYIIVLVEEKTNKDVPVASNEVKPNNFY